MYIRTYVYTVPAWITVCGVMHVTSRTIACALPFLMHSPCLLVQASSEAEMLAHICQVKDLELKLKARGEEARVAADEWKAKEEGLRAEVDHLEYRVGEIKGKVEEKELQCQKVQAELEEVRAEVCGG